MGNLSFVSTDFQKPYEIIALALVGQEIRTNKHAYAALVGINFETLQNNVEQALERWEQVERLILLKVNGEEVSQGELVRYGRLRESSEGNYQRALLDFYRAKFLISPELSEDEAIKRIAMILMKADQALDKKRGGQKQVLKTSEFRAAYKKTLSLTLNDMHSRLEEIGRPVAFPNTLELHIAGDVVQISFETEGEFTRIRGFLEAILPLSSKKLVTLWRTALMDKESVFHWIFEGLEPTVLFNSGSLETLVSVMSRNTHRL